MAAPVLNATINTNALTGVGNNSTRNLPNASVYPGVTAAAVSTTTVNTLVFDTSPALAGVIEGAAGWTTTRGEGAGWWVDQTNTSATLNATQGFFVAPINIVASSLVACDTVANGGLVCAARSGVGNWRRWIVAGSDYTFYKIITRNSYQCITIDCTAPGDYADDGVFNPAAVDRIEFHFRRVNSGLCRLRIDDAFFISPLTITQGEIANPATLGLISDYFDFETGTLQSNCFSKLGDDLYLSFLPKINVGNGTDFVYFQEAIALRIPVPSATNRIYIAAVGKAGLTLKGGSAGSVVNIANSSFGGGGNGGRGVEFDFVSELNSTTTLNANNLIINAPGNTLLNQYYSQTGGAFVGRHKINLNGGALASLTIRESPDTSALTLNGSIENLQIRSNVGAGIEIDLNGSLTTDYSDQTATIRDNGTYDVRILNTGAGSGVTYSLDISGFTKPVGSTTPVAIYVDDSNTANIYNIFTNSTYAQADAGSAGATVNILAPAPAITVLGFPDGSDIAVQQGGRTLDAVFNVNPPYEYQLEAGEAPAYIITISKQGYETSVITVTPEGENQTVPVALRLEASSDNFNLPLSKFVGLMSKDSGFLRIASEADNTAGLLDEALMIRTHLWLNTAYKQQWNSVVGAIAPTTGEINAWVGYLATSGLTTISFNSSTGEVS